MKNMEETYLKLAKDFFNHTWDLMDKKEERTPLDNENMLGYAHASRLIWGFVGKKVNFARGEWQISRVYCLLKRPKAALHHALECKKWTDEAELKDFDLSFSYEALARAHSCNQNHEEANKFFKMAMKSSEKISKIEDKDYFLQDLKQGPWFGLKFT